MRNKGTIRMIALAFLIALVPTASPAHAQVKTIGQFVKCLNANLAAASDISDTVQCIPDGCTITLTMSQESAQAACTISSCQLPRVILNCAGPQSGKSNTTKFRPSYLLCPTGSDGGLNRVEIGQDVKVVDLANGTGAMKMADVPIPAGDFRPLTQIMVMDNTTDLPGANKGCTGCHGDGGVQRYTSAINDVGDQLSTPINTFGGDRAPLIIDTNDSDAGADFEVCPSDPPFAQALPDVCKCVSDNVAGANDIPNGALVLKLCNALNNYQMTRGSNAAHAPECL